ncbi:hypothetical protein KBD45_01595 [Candidatus Dojkabacteria bacterium]|nr:hypothetical protein [Candidatus Dojkabacteria bacterium]
MYTIILKKKLIREVLGDVLTFGFFAVVAWFFEPNVSLGILVLMFVSLGVIFISHYFQNRSSNSVKLEELARKFSGETVFLCTDAEDLGDDLYQFFGNPKGDPIRPKMGIVIASQVFRIFEVYAEDSTPDKADLELKDGMTETVIVIKTKSFDFKSFKKSLKLDKVIVLKVE